MRFTGGRNGLAALRCVWRLADSTAAVSTVPGGAAPNPHLGEAAQEKLHANCSSQSRRCVCGTLSTPTLQPEERTAADIFPSAGNSKGVLASAKSMTISSALLPMPTSLWSAGMKHPGLWLVFDNIRLGGSACRTGLSNSSLLFD